MNRTPKQWAAAPASDLALGYLSARLSEIKLLESDLRAEVPDSIHQMRTVVRKSRSTLAAYREELASLPTRQMSKDLKWLGRVLGEARDTEVVHHRLIRRLAELPATSRSAEMSTSIDTRLAPAFATANANVLRVLGSNRYARLLESLARLSPPEQRSAPTTKQMKIACRRVMRSEIHKLRIAYDRAVVTPEGHCRDAALHEVRKCAKRLMHCAEAQRAIRPRRAPEVFALAREISRALGEAHDSVICRDLLARWETNQRLPPSARDTYRRITEREGQLYAEALQEYTRAMTRLEEYPHT
ncbi:hypothetical protein GCM10027417_11480 [Glutamicibacter endophyticus]